MADVELILDAQAVIGEGPLWDSNRKVLWWVDIPVGLIHCYDPATNENRTYEAGQMVGTVVTRQSGGLMLAVENGFASFNPDTSHLQIVCDPEEDRPENRFNDGKCDPQGRFWAGTMPKAERSPSGSLYCLHSDGRCEQQADGITVSNGIVWNADSTCMYYIDSPTRKVDRFDFDAETGAATNRQTVIEVPDGLGNPDGMAIDSEGMLWIGMWGGWCVTRFNPITGELLSKLDIPAAHVTACAFGGDDLRDLYITTARDRVPEADLPRQPHAGGLFRTRVDVTGTPSFAYTG